MKIWIIYGSNSIYNLQCNVNIFITNWFRCSNHIHTYRFQLHLEPKTLLFYVAINHETSVITLRFTCTFMYLVKVQSRLWSWSTGKGLSLLNTPDQGVYECRFSDTVYMRNMRNRCHEIAIYKHIRQMDPALGSWGSTVEYAARYFCISLNMKSSQSAAFYLYDNSVPNFKRTPEWLFAGLSSDVVMRVTFITVTS